MQAQSSKPCANPETLTVTHIALLMLIRIPQYFAQVRGELRVHFANGAPVRLR
jgi:hypothetical protein